MKKIILFGDSIFNGYRNGRDTDLITDGIRASLDNQFQVENLSKSGATTATGIKLLNRIDPQAKIVVIEYGSNDMSNSWGIDRKDYAQNLDKMVETIEPKRAIIVGPLYPNPHNQKIMQYYKPNQPTIFNQVAKACAQKYKIPFVNIISTWQKLDNISSYYQEDGEHFLDKGNDLLISKVSQAIKAKLNK